MIVFGRNLRTVVTVVVAVGCLVLAVGWPGWREELRAQGYTLFAPVVSIDICELDQAGSVRVGGKLGEDGRAGEAVFVSRGNRNQIVAAVLGDGTFEGVTAPGFAQPGQKVTVAIRKSGGEGALMAACELGVTGVGRR